jgi:hypothetical protein
MNKRIVGKLNKIAERFKLVETAKGIKELEEMFSSKTIAIVKYRVGLDNGQMHSVEETAKAFKVSESWVLQAQKKIENYVFGKTTGKKRAVKKVVAKKAVVPAEPKPAKLTMVGSFNMATGEVNIEMADSNLNDESKEALTQLFKMVYEDTKGRTVAKMRKEAHDITTSADSKGLIGILLILVGIVIEFGVVFWSQSIIATIGGLVLMAVGVVKLITANSLSSEARGLRRASRM